MIQKIMLLMGCVLLGGLLYGLSSVLTPFLVAAVLAYMADPLIHHLQRFKLPRTVAVVCVFIFVILLFLLLPVMLIPILGQEFQLFLAHLPDMLNWLQQTALPWWISYTGIPLSLDISAIKTLLTQHWQQTGNVMLFVLQTLAHSSNAVFSWLLNLILVPVVTFYLLRDWTSVIQGANQLLPRTIEPAVTSLCHACNEVLGAFFRGQLFVMLGLCFFYSTALSLIGLQFAFLMGCVIGVVSIVPYLGLIIGILMALLGAVFQFHDLSHVLPVIIVFSVGQLLESMVLTPWLVGDRIGLHPVFVIFILLAGGELFGFFGVLLALPVGAVLRVLLQDAKQRYIKTTLYAGH